MNSSAASPTRREVKIRVHDGADIAVALYMPEGEGPFPVLLAPSPYRYDNNALPATPQFLWRETGPIDLYVERGYVYAQMDVRGCGKSGGEFRFLDRAEQKDLYDVVEWLGRQPWSSGKVGGIGQSYFCMLQWWMAIQQPPSLACIAAFDGLNDPYRASVYQGGIWGDFFGGHWWNQNRIINRHPADGEQPREQQCDLNLLLQRHPTYDEFWRERCAAERLDEIEVPLYSIGVWGKVDLHTRGNIDGFRRARGPKKLKMIGPANAFVANREFNSRELHESLLLPFYDHYLKGLDTDYARRPAVEYFVRGADAVRSAETWPPPGLHYETWHLSAAKSGSVTSFNDGSLTVEPAAGEEQTSYRYPDPEWMMGVVGFGPNGAPDPARRVLTFTTAPLNADLEIAGPIKLVLYASSSRDDMDFIVKLSEQMPQSAADRAQGLNPASSWITKGWLRASHRALDPQKSTAMEPYHSHSDPTPIAPGQVYRFDIGLEPMAHRFRKGNRIRLEIVNGDSAVTDLLWTHYYLPNKIGTDTIHHAANYPSALILPVMERGAEAAPDRPAEAVRVATESSGETPSAAAVEPEPAPQAGRVVEVVPARMPAVSLDGAPLVGEQTVVEVAAAKTLPAETVSAPTVAAIPEAAVADVLLETLPAAAAVAENLEGVLQGGENGNQLGADILDRGNDRHRDAGAEQAVFNRGRTRFVFEKFLNLLEHWLPRSKSHLRRKQIPE